MHRGEAAAALRLVDDGPEGLKDSCRRSLAVSPRPSSSLPLHTPGCPERKPPPAHKPRPRKAGDAEPKSGPVAAYPRTSREDPRALHRVSTRTSPDIGPVTRVGACGFTPQRNSSDGGRSSSAAETANTRHTSRKRAGLSSSWVLVALALQQGASHVRAAPVARRP